MVKRSIHQRIRPRNFDAKHGRIETGAVVKNRQGLIGVERGKVLATSGKKKASDRKSGMKKANVGRETSAVSGMGVTIVHKNLTPKAATLSVSIPSCTQTRFSRPRPRPRLPTRTPPSHYNTTPSNTWGWRLVVTSPWM